MYLEEIETTQKAIQELSEAIEESNAELKTQSDKVEDLVIELKEAQNLFQNMRGSVQEETYKLTLKKRELEDLYAKEAAYEREEGIKKLIADQPSYEEDLEKIIRIFIDENNTGLSFEAKKNPKDLVEEFVRREKGYRFDDVEIEARSSRQRWKNAMRRACENHYDKAPVNKYERIRGLETFVRHPKVAEMIL